MNLMQMRCSVLSHIVKIADINARVTSATYYSQLSKRSHMQLVSWVAKTRTNMSRLVANTSHPANNHYNSNPDTIWTNLVAVLCRRWTALDGQRHVPAALSPDERPGNHCAGVCVVLRAGLSDAENLASIRVRSPDPPTRSESLHCVVQAHLHVYKTEKRNNFEWEVKAAAFLVVVRPPEVMYSSWNQKELLWSVYYERLRTNNHVL